MKVGRRETCGDVGGASTLSGAAGHTRTCFWAPMDRKQGLPSLCVLSVETSTWECVLHLQEGSPPDMKALSKCLLSKQKGHTLGLEAEIRPLCMVMSRHWRLV